MICVRDHRYQTVLDCKIEMLTKFALDPIPTVNLNLKSSGLLLRCVQLGDSFLKPRIVRAGCQKYKDIELRTEVTCIRNFIFNLLGSQPVLVPRRAVSASSALNSDARAVLLVNPKDVDARLWLSGASVQIHMNVVRNACKEVARQTLKRLPIVRTIESSRVRETASVHFGLSHEFRAL